MLLATLPEHKRKDYTDLIIELAKRFNPATQTYLCRAQLKIISRRENQSLPELGEEIHRLVQLAYSTVNQETLDVLGKQYFIDALEDNDLRWMIYQRRAETLDEAVCAALQLEAYRKAEGKRAQKRPVLL